MKLTIFFFLFLIGGIYLVKENIFLEASFIYLLGLLLVLFSIFGLSFSLADQIKENFNLTYKQKDYFVIVIWILLVIILVSSYENYIKYQTYQLSINNKEITTKVDSVKYEKRGKLAPHLYFYYSYKVNGEQYHFSKENKEGFGIWQKILVKYAPDNPSNHKVLELKKEKPLPTTPKKH